jgi:molybdate transport system substrate-binding protein
MQPAAKSQPTAEPRTDHCPRIDSALQWTAKGSIMNRLVLAALVTALLLPLTGPGAGAAEIHVLSPTAVSAGMRELAKSFTQETGTVVDFTFANAGTIPATLAGDAPADLVVLPAADMDTIDQKGALKAGTKTKLGRVEMAYLVKTGAPHPDISTPEKFRAVLLASSSVAINDPSTGSAGGVILARVFKDPQFADVKFKLVPAGPGKVMAGGGAETAIQSMSEVVGVPGIEIVGPLPAFWQAHLDFAVAVPAKSTASDAGLAFLHYITRADAASVWKASGVDR